MVLRKEIVNTFLSCHVHFQLISLIYYDRNSLTGCINLTHWLNPFQSEMVMLCGYGVVTRP